MSCRDVRKLLPRYVDGDLPPLDVARVAEHLEGCADCRRRLELQRRLAGMLAHLPEPKGAAAGEARLRARMAAALEGEERRRARRGALERWGNALGWAAASAVGLLLIAGVILTGRPLVEQRFGAPPPPTRPATSQPAATPISPTVRYLSPELGFSVECPAAWTARTSGPGVEAPGWLRLGSAGFASDGYVQGDQALGHYAIQVSVLQAPAPAAAEAVRAWLAIVDPGYRQAVGQRSTTLAGEPAVELTNLPDGSREVWAVHEGRLYRLHFLPPQASGRDAVAVAAYERFVQSFAFVPSAETAAPPAGTSTPAPTTPPGVTPTAPVPPTPGSPSPTPVPSPTPTAVLPTYARPVTSLAVTPHEQPIVYAIVGGRLCRSADRGATWAEESIAGLPAGVSLNAVALDFRHPETMYLLTGQGIYRRQGPAAWQRISDLQATALAVDMVDANTLWAGVLQKEAGQGVIVCSRDGGRTWQPAGPEVEISPLGTWAADILVNPNDPSMLWAVVRSNRRDLAPAGVLYRGDREGHWQRLSLGAFEPATGNVDSVEVAGIAYDPNANLLFVGSERSNENAGRILVLRAPNADAADAGSIRWEVAKYIALPIEPCYAPGLVRPLAVDARAPRSLYAATDIVWCGDESPLDRYRLLASHDDGANWDTLQMTGLP